VGDEHWPLFRLRIVTPQLELRYPNDADAYTLVDLATAGIHDTATMPFQLPWTDEPSPRRERGSLQFYWRTRAEWTPQRWQCVFAVVLGGQIVGVQDLGAENFAVLREVVTGSWLGRAHQGQGIGKEMRAAVLHFAFAGLGAEYALSTAFHDNIASRRVSEALGYEVVGRQRKLRRDVPDWSIDYRMTRESWERRRRDDFTIEGLEPCLDLFGVG
jgi:RimJ/RimL family protein N-acetyltransferase